MRVTGVLLVLLGIAVIVLGAIRHFTAFMLKTTAHASVIIGVIGLIVLVIGVGLVYYERRSHTL